MKLQCGHLTITADHTKAKGAAKWNEPLNQSKHILASMNSSRICCFSKNQNCIGKLLTKIFYYIVSLSETWLGV